MSPDDVRAFVRRDWDAIAAVKSAYWTGRFQQEGWLPAWTAADELWADLRRARPDYPNDDERAQDLAAHRLLCRRLDRAADAFPSR
jgi:hypothetical protein